MGLTIWLLYTQSASIDPSPFSSIARPGRTCLYFAPSLLPSNSLPLLLHLWCLFPPLETLPLPVEVTFPPSLPLPFPSPHSEPILLGRLPIPSTAAAAVSVSVSVSRARVRSLQKSARSDVLYSKIAPRRHLLPSTRLRAG
ncbi:unnamed protein product [Somion occarium]|uniref:Uncharacterized protein n=1 Tax=Somion occarium TaxID=3059160 RepID=A0ABP1E7P7_9APHY